MFFEKNRSRIIQHLLESPEETANAIVQAMKPHKRVDATFTIRIAQQILFAVLDWYVATTEEDSKSAPKNAKPIEKANKTRFIQALLPILQNFHDTTLRKLSIHDDLASLHNHLVS